MHIEEADFKNHLKEQYKKGFELIQEFVEKYPNNNDDFLSEDLVRIFCEGAKLLNINFIITPGDDIVCPRCNYIHGKFDKISSFVFLGTNLLCVYCSIENEYDRIMKHNPWDVNECKHEPCPHQGKTDWSKNGRGQCDEGKCWTSADCKVLYQGFESMYNKILEEL